MTDVKAFRRACQEAARRTGGDLTRFRISDEPTPNFHQAIIAYADRTVAVVCVRDAPLLATAIPASLTSVTGGPRLSVNACSTTGTKAKIKHPLLSLIWPTD